VEAVPASVNFAPDYRVEIFVEKAWGTTKGEVVLAARWNISDSHGTIVATDAAVFSQKGWRESDFKGLAERLSRLGAELAKAIQKDLSSLDEKAKNT